MKSAPIHIAEIERAERARIDWDRVHLAADRRKPFALQHPLTKRDFMGAAA
jgi:hypothetical protein